MSTFTCGRTLGAHLRWWWANVGHCAACQVCVIWVLKSLWPARVQNISLPYTQVCIPIFQVPFTVMVSSPPIDECALFKRVATWISKKRSETEGGLASTVQFGNTSSYQVVSYGVCVFFGTLQLDSCYTIDNKVFLSFSLQILRPLGEYTHTHTRLLCKTRAENFRIFEQKLFNNFVGTQIMRLNTFGPKRNQF